VFLAEKQFEGCGGLAVTEEMRVAIAGHACLLLLGDPDDYYPRLGTVVIYPESFAAPLHATDHLGIVTETVEERLGESWEEGTVVLAWDSIAAIARGSGADGNVILHEFAHQIDAQRGLTSSGRLLVPNGRCRGWEEMLQAEKGRQRMAQRRGRPTLLDPYAFNSPQELFAVATEACFTHPVRFLAGHPELYREVQAVYGLDPANWLLKNGG
jgi:Mlc titration factor MtfA (ptsG expression regulator)